MKRLFVGIPVSDDVAVKIAAIQKGLEGNLILSPRDNLHFTLCFLGNVDEGRIEELFARLEELRREKFEVALQDVKTFPSVVWVGCESEELIHLMEDCRGLFSDVKLELKEPVPHVTIARGSGGNEQKVDVGKMIVEKIVLYESVSIGNGSKYIALKEMLL